MLKEYKMKRGRKRNHIFSKQALDRIGPVIRIEDKRSTPHAPEATPCNKLAPSPIHKGDKVEKTDKASIKAGRIKFEGQYLPQTIDSYSGDASKLRNDINDLWPLFKKELEEEMKKRHDNRWVTHHASEVKLWKRFCYAYTRFYQNIAKACDYSGISRNHFYRARNTYPTFALILDIIEDRLMDEVEETTKKHSLLPNSIVERIFLLKSRRKDKYSENPQLISATKIEVNIPNISSMRGDGTDVKVQVSDNDGLQPSSDPIEVSPIKE